MSHGEKIDALGQLTIKYGDDRRRRTLTTSDRVVKETVEHHFQLAASAGGDKTTDLDLGGLGTSTLGRWILFESDHTARLLFNTVAGVTASGYGWDVGPNGWIVGHNTLASGDVRVVNRSTVSTATISVAIFLVSST